MSALRVVRAFATARWHPRTRSRRALEWHQAARLTAHLRFLRVHSPWFRDAPARLAYLPLMDKRTMMDNFDAMNTVGVTRAEAEAAALRAENARTFDAAIGGVAIGLSSGTSGERGIFLTSQAERDDWAGTVLARTLPKRRILGHRIALFLRANSALYETVRSRAVQFSFFDTHDDIDRSAERLAQLNPTIVVGPPSVLREIIKRSPKVSPERVYSVAEVLDPVDARALREGFGVDRIHQLYQCTEGFLAHTCTHGTLHLNEDYVLVEREWLDQERFVPIITDFSRRSQPIVRYRLNDVLVARATPCECGSALTALERIEGREGDSLVLGGTVVFADLVGRAMMRVDGLTDYRVIQVAADRIEVQLPDATVAESVREHLNDLWTRVRVPPPMVSIEPLVPDRTVKQRRVTRTWNEET